MTSPEFPKMVREKTIPGSKVDRFRFWLSADFFEDFQYAHLPGENWSTRAAQARYDFAQWLKKYGGGR